MEENSLLYHFWKRSKPELASTEIESTWNKEIEHLNSRGISMEKALEFLFLSYPDFKQFSNWVHENSKLEKSSESGTIEPELSSEDLLFWEENGYIVLKQVIPENDCSDAANAIWEYLNADPKDPQSWYKTHPGKKGMMLQLFDHPSLEKNRNSLRIKKAYEQLYQHAHIYKSIDKVSFNPPEIPHHKYTGSDLHWDVSLSLPIPTKFQGLLYLSNCSENEGAFHCVPGFHRKIDTWMKEVPDDIHPRQWALQDLKIQAKAIVGKAGDFIIWHQALPHCASPNHGVSPRLVQYLSYIPENYIEQDVWI